MRFSTLWIALAAICVIFSACESDVHSRPFGCVQVLTGTCVPAKEVTGVDDQSDIGFPVYWVGQEINGLKFSSLSSTGEFAPQGQGVTFDYGVCKIGFGVHIQATDPANVGLAARSLRRLSVVDGTSVDAPLAPPQRVDCFGPSTGE
jgi:hypothetical protein